MEIERRIFHIISGLIIVGLYSLDIIEPIHMLTFFAVSLLVLLINKHHPLPIITKALQIMERKEYLEKFPGLGAVNYVFGITTAMYLFPKNIALASILLLVLSDPISSLIGKLGKLPYINKKKNWEGLLSGMFVGFISANMFVSTRTAILASTITMLIEGLDIKLFGWKIDDNLYIPALAGTIMILV